MNTLTVQQQEKVQNSVNQIAAYFGTGYNVTSYGGIVVDQSVTPQDIATKARGLYDTYLINDKVSGKFAIMMGHMVLNYMAQQPHIESAQEAAVEMNLVDGEGEGLNKIVNWSKIAAKFTEDDYHENLSISHFMRAASYAEPLDVAKAAEFREGRSAILQVASNEGQPVKWVDSEMQKLKARLEGKEAPSHMSVKDLLVAYVATSRIAGFPDEALSMFQTSRKEVSDRLEEYGNLLREKKLLPAEDSLITAPWQSQVLPPEEPSNEGITDYSDVDF